MAATTAPTHVSHHDATRAAVSTTALGACALRVWESKKDPAERPWSRWGLFLKLSTQQTGFLWHDIHMWS